MRYRSRTEIISDILTAANGGITKTKIMYKAFLSFNQLREYLTSMVENDLITYDSLTQVYRTTPKGMRLLQMSEQLGSMLMVSEHARR